MEWSGLLETLGERPVAVAGGALIGVAFGALAQRSRFCLRAAVVEVARGEWLADARTRSPENGHKLAVWLLTFATAVVVAQALILAGWLDVSGARQLATRGSLSGAVLGGLLFGIGMILARGCASRQLVVAATGNLRALLTGLVFAVTAQASLSGLLAPLRTAVAGWWTVDGGARDLLALASLGHGGGLVVGLMWLAAAALAVRRAQLPLRPALAAAGVGGCVAAAWWFTATLAGQSFEPLPVQSLSFTGPSADMLMQVLAPLTKPLGFDTGLVPGVVLGAFLAAWRGGDLKLEGFQGGEMMRRYIAGAICMGFGGMLAGGCAVGAGISGAAIFAVTSWLTLVSMWLGATLTDRWLDQPQHRLVLVAG
ncbi:hypothetical protein OTERR_22860 [Oryzomicrobium terrae]|uniref:Uncharacterized protein n=1 Tax=Oryzomicrobium terrae TaxID=1735038 RepID=A0A5C1EA23_9RHOO|nr:YeeE/YedE family protein [Oryzomicrobium terrae]QEL65762.1 hypothetical protein OTERR_22860 [Oryzomicrobium terrae]